MGFLTLANEWCDRYLCHWTEMNAGALP